MARINLDQHFFSDPRITALSSFLNESVYQTRGRLITLWHEAYLRRTENLGEKIIDMAGGIKGFAKALCDVDLAEALKEDAYRIKGVAERIEYLKNLDATKSIAGKASAVARQAKYGSSTPPNKTHKKMNTSRTRVEHEMNRDEQNSTQLNDTYISNTISIPVSTSIPTPVLNTQIYVSQETEFQEIHRSSKQELGLLDKTESNRESLCHGSSAVTNVRAIKPGSLVWDAYAAAYRHRYNIEPVRNAKMNALCKQLVDRLGPEAAQRVAMFYLTHNSQWYITQGHALQYCVKDAEKLHTEAIAGRQITAQIARQIDASHSNQQAIDIYLEQKRRKEREENAV